MPIVSVCHDDDWIAWDKVSSGTSIETYGVVMVAIDDHISDPMPAVVDVGDVHKFMSQDVGGLSQRPP